jgi:prostaglandin-endoperoxide synthase 2
LEDESLALTQDFVLMDNPAFFGRDVKANRHLAEAILASRRPSLLKRMLFALPERRRRTMYVLLRHFLLGLRFRELRVLLAATGKRPPNPLGVTYWSATPYRIGAVAVKYKAVPASANGGPAISVEDDDSPHRLRAAMKAALLADEARFDLFAQPWAGSRDRLAAAVEDASVEWREAEHPLVKVAQIVIPSQVFDAPAQLKLAEDLAFTPWHSLPEHRPLGGVNRARRAIYQHLSTVRRRLNGVPVGEPTTIHSSPQAPSQPATMTPQNLASAGSGGRKAKIVYGFRNRVERYVLTRFGPLWRLANRIRPLERVVNRVLINRAVNKCPARPHRLSMRSEYPSWDSLTDRTYTGRHLPPADDAFVKGLPDVADVLPLFARPNGLADLSAKSTALFAHFAQWFTDGFLRTARLASGGPDWQRNTSNHEIDLSPVYGRTRTIADALRCHDGSGKLRHQFIPQGTGQHGRPRVGGQFPPYFFDDDYVTGAVPQIQWPVAGTPPSLCQTCSRPLPTQFPHVRAEFAGVAHELLLLREEQELLVGDPDRMRARFALGVERANNQVGYVMLNVLFLREHNRLCDILKAAHPTWDDDRLYHTARNTVIVMVIKLVVEEYINHISPFHFQFRAQPESFYRSKWYRMNWMTLEFNLLYRWHGLVPDDLRAGSHCLPLNQTLFNNGLLIDVGLAAAFDSASRQPAGRVGLRNTAKDLIPDVEKRSVELGRAARLQSYNAYREYAGYPRVTSFDQITSDRWLQSRLSALYGHPDNLEFYVGLFAEDIQPESAVPPLAGRLVAVDAFSQALTNPLLSEHVFREDTFVEGWEWIHTTSSLGDVLRRNIMNEPVANPVVSMTQR